MNKKYKNVPKNASYLKKWNTLTYDTRCLAFQITFRKLLEINCIY